MNKVKWYLPIFIVFYSICAQSTIVHYNLFVIQDSMLTVNGEKLPYVSYNLTNHFRQENPILNARVGDTLTLLIHNRTNNVHQFQIQGLSKSPIEILPKDTAFVEVKRLLEGAFIYFDPYDFPVNSYFGLSGMLVVKNHSHKSFYWNLKDHQYALNFQLSEGTSVDWALYEPNLFTINGKSNPDINIDSDAKVIGSVGDTLVIHITNTGLGIHSLHFHGYHVEIVYSSKFPNHVGRKKDPLPIHPMASMILQLIPDKPGEYPVHDHNLAALRANKKYPKGMFTTLSIDP